MTDLRPYQVEVKAAAYGHWQAGARNVVLVLPTGAGKTCTFSNIMAEQPCASVAIVHRQELVSQMSMALARNGVRHRVIGTPALVRSCVKLHMDELGCSYYDPGARTAAAGVDTLIRMDGKDPWFLQVGLWVVDECHHHTLGSKWHRATEMFPNARGLGVTATPFRTDGKGLGRHADSVFDAMVVGPSMRDLTRMGFLTDYRVFAPPSDIDLSTVNIGASGDFVGDQLRKAVHRSHIVGDVVQHYQKLAAGKLGVTFCVDVEASAETAQAYRNAGVPAEVISAKTPDDLRASILRRFKNREILQICNVDILGEGFDAPGIEVVSFARPTMSRGLLSQQFGRALRPMAGKDYAIIIDHVGNIHRHGLPDAVRALTLDARERRSRGGPSDVIPVRSCPQCLAAYERIHRACPYCGFVPEPPARSAPEHVDGDLMELDPAVLAQMRGEIERIDAAPIIPHGAAPEVAGAIKRNHRLRQEAQAALREAMALWGGARTAEGLDVPTAQRLFYHRYGVDVATAQALGRTDADALREQITRTI